MMDEKDRRPVVIKRVTQCARCGEDHQNLVAHKLDRPWAPPEARGVTWTHWMPCPTNGQPILVLFTSAPTEGPDGPAVKWIAPPNSGESGGE